MSSNNGTATGYMGQLLWDEVHGYTGSLFPGPVRDFYLQHHQSANANSSAPSGQHQTPTAPSLHPTAFLVLGVGAAAIALGGTRLGPFVNLSLVAVIVYEITLYKPPPPPQMA